MAITVNTQIAGQQANSTASYCYLYEPLRVAIFEDDLTATKIYIDLVLLDTTNSTVVIDTLVRYGEYDINPGNNLTVDLMKLAQQNHDANIFNYSHIDEIVENSVGWHSVVSKYKYQFNIYSDITTTPIEVVKLPIIGGRFFRDFEPTITNTNNITELDEVGLSISNVWINYPFITSSLGNVTSQDARPIIDKIISTQGDNPCGGYIVWKSRLGGWMSWGFDIKTEKFKKKYDDKIEVGMFESTQEINGNAYVEADYSGISTSYSFSLKALSLSSEELRAVSGIQSSPAVYYMKDSSGSLELMRLNSATTPLESLTNGGDFSVSLESISTSNFKTK